MERGDLDRDVAEPLEQGERDAHRLEQEGAVVDRHIESARDEWERKKKDASVPGARPDDPEDVPPPSEVQEGETSPGGPG